MLEHYEIHSVEELRAIADVLRLRIIDLLQDHPMTVTQLGEIMGMAAAKVHYHVRELEKVGLLQLVETREKGGILEKYYQPIAKDLSVSKNLFLNVPPDESLAATSRWFEQVKDGFLQALRSALAHKDEEPNLMLAFTHVHVTPKEYQQLGKQIYELIRPYESRRNIEGEMPMLFTLLSYPQVGDRPAPSMFESMPPESNWAVGAIHYTRTQLEQVVAEGKRLNIHVTGICSFAKDIPAELADDAVEHFHLVGKLEASAAVREVLLRKRS